MALPSTRAAYQGLQRRLLLAFDVGTTFSGISYSILDPGQVPKIYAVTRFPGQQRVGGDTKIPTVIYYDADGKIGAIGAETLDESMESTAEEKGWLKAHWFKLLHKPSTLAVDANHPLPSLPAGKTVIDVTGDYMRHLQFCAEKYIKETHGVILWNSVKDNIFYVLTHPNGWGGPQQASMRRTAVLADLIPSMDDAQSRIRFVTEGEASLHFCLESGLSLGPATDTNDVSASDGVLIIDAGGGTIDITAYRRYSVQSFEEIAVPTCYNQGAIFVTRRAESYISAKLEGSRFEQDLPMIATRFDRNAKHIFRSADSPCHIQFTSFRDNDPSLNVRGGRLVLEGTVVASFFEPSVTCIVNAIKQQSTSAHFPIKSAFLVGGFSASDWLYEEVKKAIEPLGISVSRPDTHINKAVSNGAVSFYLDNAVTSRMSRSTYGVKISRTYEHNNKAHRARSSHTSIHPITGEPRFEQYFDTILPKDTRVRETKEFRCTYNHISSTPKFWRFVETDILCYAGSKECHPWMPEEPGAYPVVCTVKADVSAVVPYRSVSNVGVVHYRRAYDIVLLFGLTELQAQVAYFDNGVEKRGKASIVYETIVEDPPEYESEEEDSE